jgi:protein-tyrosine phosphatase
MVWDSHAVVFAVLFVCSGNVCRSPLAERLLRTRLVTPNPIACSSAGVRALAGRPMELHTARVLRELGGDPHGHVARRLTIEQIAAADLILTAEAAHRADVLALAPLAFRRVFTLREFVRLGEGLNRESVTLEDLRARVGEVANQRGLRAAVDSRADDMADPLRRFGVTARMAGREASAALDALIAVLGLTPVGAGRPGELPEQRLEDRTLEQQTRRFPDAIRLEAAPPMGLVHAETGGVPPLAPAKRPSESFSL